MNYKSKKIISAICALVFYAGFAIFTYFVKNFDLQEIAPDGSLVGFASLNLACKAQFGASELWYEITEILGWFAIFICLVFAGIGLYQFIKGRGIAKVDKDIICMGILYLICIIAYIVFAKITINVRPVFESDGSLESSYPSSHTILAICVFASLLIEIARRIKDPAKALLEEISCMGIIFITVTGRFLSGAHWASDIIGGIIISIAFIFTFLAILPEPPKAE